MSDDLTLEEQAYFDSGGVTDFPTKDSNFDLTFDDSSRKKEAGVYEETHNRMAPLADLQEERARAKEYREQVHKIQSEKDQLLGEMRAYIQAMQTQNVSPAPELTEDSGDLIGYLKQEVQKAKQATEELKQFKAQQEAARQQQEFETAVGNAWMNSVEKTKDIHPDIDNAAHHVLNQRTAMLKSFGLNDKQIEDTIRQEFIGVVVQSNRQGRNPADVVYDMALATGYTSKNRESINSLRQGLSSSKSLSSTGGFSFTGATNKDMAAQVANLSESEFEQWMEKNPNHFRRLFGSDY
ncbi:MAG: hypothetical protein JSC085_000991 [Candidatus Tokpelaia sp. JSC085]|nr:MAG: hypothetical protein JSC085_000991 [Candidatus Tokpelaia sp. JSC085]